MSVTGRTLQRIASLNLPTEAFQEVLKIIAEMQAADDDRRERQRQRKVKSREKTVTVTGKERDGAPSDSLKEDTTSEAKASSVAAAAAPSEPVYTDSRHELWGEGTAILAQLGVPSKDSRPNIGRWLKAAKDDAQTVLGAIQRARDNRVHDPIPWITKALGSPTNGQRSHHAKPSLADTADDLITRTRDLERKAGIGCAADDPFAGDGAGQTIDGTLAERPTR